MSYKTRLAKMFKENTGSHFLDSGGAYGRNWERNQKRNLMKEPFQSVEFSVNEGKADVNVTVNACQWLAETLDAPDKTIMRHWNNFKRQAKKRDNTWFSECDTFVSEYLPEHGIAVGGLYGDNSPITENIYNGNNVLSQVFQYTYFTAVVNGTETECVLLMVHGGCDVRGGYTQPQLFGLSVEGGIFYVADATISCEKGHSWHTDDSYNFYSDGDSLDMKDYAAIEVEPEGLDEALEMTKRAVELSINQLTLPIEVKQKGLHTGALVVCDGVGYCPLCATKIG